MQERNEITRTSVTASPPILIRCPKVVSAIAIIMLALGPIHAAEPSYDGAPLSEWLLLSVNGNPQAKEAIMKIGTNGIPTLLKILSATDWNKKRIVASLESEELQREFKARETDVEGLRSLAVSGFGILGTNAESAIPQLVKMFHRPQTQFQAACALAEVGPKGFAIITNAMSDPNLEGGLIVAVNQHGGGDPKVVTQLYLHGLKSENPIIRGNAADYLANREPAVAIPALIPILDDKEYYPRARASIALASYGPLAKAAAPKLFCNFTNHPDPIDLAGLRKIDRQFGQEAETFLLNSGPTNFARGSYTRTLLKSGSELIAGGYIHTEVPAVKNRILVAAELINPTTGSWSETGEMTAARYGHAAVLLQDGRVLVSGGVDGPAHALSSAELYDPATGKWAKTGALNIARFNHKATLLRDGKVMISGGHDVHESLSTSELYDPSIGAWTVVAGK
jgi:hypothetical protein